LKKIAIALALTLVLGLSVTAQGQQSQELFFMHYLTGADGFALGALVDRFNAEHPDIQVVASTTPGMVDKFLVQSAAGTPPDIAMAAPEMLQLFAEAGLLSALETNRFKTIAAQEDEYVPVAWESAVYRDILYGIPLGVGALGLYMNPRMFDEVGIEAKPPETAAELSAAVRSLNRDTDGDGVWDVAGLELPFNHDIMISWFSVLKQYGGDIFDADGAVAFGSPAGLRALEELTAFFRDNGLALEPRRDFIQEQSAMSLRKAAARYNMVRGEVTYKTGPFPRFGDQPGAWAGVQTVVIPKATHAPQRLEAIYTFVEWLGNQGLEWATELGHLPARWDVIRSPEIMESAHHYGFAVQSMHLHTVPTVPAWSKVNGIVQPMVNQSFRGVDAPRNLMEDAVQRAKAALAE